MGTPKWLGHPSAQTLFAAIFGNLFRKYIWQVQSCVSFHQVQQAMVTVQAVNWIPPTGKRFSAKSATWNKTKIMDKQNKTKHISRVTMFRRGEPLGHGPHLRSPNFIFDIGQISIAWQLLTISRQYLFFEACYCCEIVEQLLLKCFS